MLATFAVGACGSDLSREELVQANAEAFRLAAADQAGPATRRSTPAVAPAQESADAAAAGSATAHPSAGEAPAPANTSVRPAPSATDPKSPKVTRPDNPAPEPSPQENRPPVNTGVPAAPKVPGEGTTETTGPKSEIRLGSMGTNSGVIGQQMQGVVDGTKAWVADVNARGGLAGHPVRLLVLDDGADPNRALALTQQLVEVDKVQALFGEHSPTTLQAIIPYIEHKGVPFIGTCSCSVPTDTSPMVFQVGIGATEGNGWSHITPLITQSDKRKVALFYCREVPTCSNIATAVRNAAATTDVKIVYEQQVSVAQPDYTAEVIQARNSGAEVIMTVADGPTGLRLTRSAHRQNWRPVLVTQHAAHEERVLKAAGDQYEGLLLASSVAEWSTSPKMADFRAAMDRYVPRGVKSSFAAQNWAAGKLLEKIATRFPAEPTSKDFLDGMNSVHLETLGGIIPPTTFEAGKPHVRTNLCVVSIRVEGGKFVPRKGPDDFDCPPSWKPVGS